ncbi:THxN family PEP-CTERM protein [Undibacterium sp.]|uniref:THxN family PEP-CTERM protein n=1 Tax=Undibacterium sp. TaxID=1914977 RepID=UPI0025D6E217|nr:THxN family PEP-CTERM protein [Undibacterium sp.]
MKLTTLRQALRLGVIAAAALTSMAASAVPVFSFTEAGGFVKNPTNTAIHYGVNTAGNTTGSNGTGGLNPTSNDTYHDISWGVGDNGAGSPSSGMNLQTFGGALGTSWTTMSRLSHFNNVINGATSWIDQIILDRLMITDSNGGASVVLDNTNPVKIDFTETPNTKPCPAPNPNGSTCDDSYAVKIEALKSITFTANDKTTWIVDFMLGNFVNAMFVGPNLVYTAEGKTSSVDVLVSVRQVPEPATLFLMGLGLLGFGIAGRRKSV